MILALLKIRLKALGQTMFGRGAAARAKKGKGSPAVRKALYALLAVYVVGMLGFSFGSIMDMLASALAPAGLGWLVLALSFIMSVTLAFVGSIFITQQMLFEANDNELLLSMPLRPSAILASRMIIVLIVNLVFSAFVMIPAFIVYCMRVAPATAASVLCFVLGFLLSAFLSTAICSVCGWAIAALTSRMRRKNLFQTVLLFVYFIGYMYFYTNLQNYAQKLIAAGSAIADAIARSIPPAHLFSRAVGAGELLALLQLAIWCLLPFAIVYIILSRTFIGVTTTRRGAKKVKYSEKPLKVSAPRSAVMKKELGRFFSMPMYMFNCGLGAVVCVLGAGALLIKGGDLLAAFAVMPAELASLLPLLAAAAIAFIAVMNDITAPSISLEGKTLWLLRSAPIPAKDIFAAKILSASLITLPPMLLFSLAAWFTLRFDAAAGALLTAFALLMQTLVNVFGLWINLRMPRMEWISETVVVKQSGSVLVAVLGGMGAVLGLAAIYLAVHRFIAPLAYISICCALCVALSALLWRSLCTGGVKKFTEL